MAELLHDGESLPHGAAHRRGNIQLLDGLVVESAVLHFLFIFPADGFRIAETAGAELHEVQAGGAHGLDDSLHGAGLPVHRGEPGEELLREAAPAAVSELHQGLHLRHGELRRILPEHMGKHFPVIAENGEILNELLQHGPVRLLSAAEQVLHIDPRAEGGLEIAVEAADDGFPVCIEILFLFAQPAFLFQKFFKTPARDLLVPEEELLPQDVPLFFREAPAVFSEAHVVQLVEYHVFRVEEGIFRQHVLAEEVGAFIGQAADEAIRAPLGVDLLAEIPGEDAAPFLPHGPGEAPEAAVRDVRRIEGPHVVGDAEGEELHDLVLHGAVAVGLLQEGQVCFRPVQDGSQLLLLQLVRNDAVVLRHGLRQELPLVDLLQNSLRFIGGILFKKCL